MQVTVDAAYHVSDELAGERRTKKSLHAKEEDEDRTKSSINKRKPCEAMQSKNGAPGMHSFTGPCETRQRKVALEEQHHSEYSE